MTTLITLLADGKFHSGEELGKALGISRAAIWKQLKKLETDTFLNIQSVRGKGYRLSSPLLLLQQKTINQAFDHWPTTVLTTTDSTNAECFRLLNSGITAPLAVTAEQQTMGKGRRGREWISPYGQNIYYSLLITLKKGAHQLEGLSLTVGLAVLKVIQNQGLASAGLKWPNDLLLDNKKLAGILLEINGDPADICHVVIGIGINVNMQKTTEQIDQPWTSLRQETGGLIDRNQLIIALNESLLQYLKIHLKHGFKALKDEWQAHNLWQNEIVNLLQGNQQIFGKMLGVDETGALKLQVNNEIEHFNAGEVSLRLAPKINL